MLESLEFHFFYKFKSDVVAFPIELNQNSSSAITIVNCVRFIITDECISVINNHVYMKYLCKTFL